MLANEVHDTPPLVALLDVTYGERRNLRAPQPAAQEHRKDRPVTLALGGTGIGSVQELLCLLDG